MSTMSGLERMLILATEEGVSDKNLGETDLQKMMDTLVENVVKMKA